MKKFYYLRDIDNRPVVTVCLLKTDKGISRGVSICSSKDNPCKATGRNISSSRAARADTLGTTGEEINREEARFVLDETIEPIITSLIKFKSQNFYAEISNKDPLSNMLSNFEIRLLGI